MAPGEAKGKATICKNGPVADDEHASSTRRQQHVGAIWHVQSQTRRMQALAARPPRVGTRIRRNDVQHPNAAVG